VRDAAEVCRGRIVNGVPVGFFPLYPSQDQSARSSHLIVADDGLFQGFRSLDSQRPNRQVRRSTGRIPDQKVNRFGGEFGPGRQAHQDQTKDKRQDYNKWSFLHDASFPAAEERLILMKKKGRYRNTAFIIT
jgi:hypothetical protein